MVTFLSLMHDVFRSLIQCPASVFTEAPISWPEKNTWHY